MTFNKESPFSIELKKRVQSILNNDSNGRFANTKTWIKAVLLIIICICLYSTILFSSLNLIDRSILILFFSFFTLILGLNVMHEAAHGNYSKNPLINRLLAYTFDVYGISSDLYNIKHIHYHHNYTNIFGHDGDISETPMIRMSKTQQWMPLHRFQKYYTFPLYSLITITWPINDLVRIFSLKIGDRKIRRPDKVTILRILFFKLMNLFFTYALPIHFFGWKQGIFFILLFHLSLGGILALIFQIAHVHEESQFDSDQINTDWYVHQIKTSADFGVNQFWTCFLMGGLNYQVIHHLFPNVSYRHYPEIQLILKELCLKHKINYHEFKSFSDATIAHFKWLDKMGDHSFTSLKQKI